MEEGKVVWFDHLTIGYPIGRKECNLIQVNKQGAKASTPSNTYLYEYNYSKKALIEH
jgi:hypothetical protein